MYYKGGRGVVPPWALSMSCRRGQVRNRLWYSPDERLPELSAGGEVVRKVKHSSVRIENPLLALYRGLGFSPEMSRNVCIVRPGWTVV